MKKNNYVLNIKNFIILQTFIILTLIIYTFLVEKYDISRAAIFVILTILLIIWFVLKLIIKLPLKLGNIFSRTLITFEKVSYNSFNDKIKYYRDLIKDYSLVEFCYIDDFDFKMPKDIVVILLNMELKGIIKLENGVITIIDKSLATRQVEKFVLDIIKDGKLEVMERDIYKYKFDIVTDALKDDLVYKSNNEKRISIIISSMVLLLFFSIYIIPVLNFNMAWYMWLLIYYIIFSIITFSISYIDILSDHPYYLTDKGKEIHEKLEGLKHFLKDFSSLDEREKKEIVLWNDYLIYSVMFNQNKKIVNDISNKYFIIK